MLRFVVATGALLLGISQTLAAGQIYPLAPFDSVDISASVSAVIDVGSAQSVSAEAITDAELQKLDAHVSGTTLYVTLKRGMMDWLFNLGNGRPVTVHVTIPSLRSASASAGASVDVHRGAGDSLVFASSSGASMSADAVAGKYVTLDSSSGGSLTVAGNCTNLIANVSSGGDLDAHGLACSEVNANASSGGHASVWASSRVKADASSGGAVTVFGKPASSTVSASFGGSVGYAN